MGGQGGKRLQVSQMREFTSSKNRLPATRSCSRVTLLTEVRFSIESGEAGSTLSGDRVS